MPAKQKPAKPVTVVFVIENNASYRAFGVSKMLSGAYLQSRYTYHTSIRSYDVYQVYNYKVVWAGRCHLPGGYDVLVLPFSLACKSLYYVLRACPVGTYE